jgi:PAS domain S-box-containing protein
LGFFDQLFNSQTLTPHGVCLLWRPTLLWLHVVSDALIGLSYYSIPLALASLVIRRRDISFGWMFWMFAAFILACGTTHFLSIWTLWHPDYGIEGLVKLVTACLSVTTAAILWPLIPKALSLPSPESLRSVNAILSRQVIEREQMLGTLRQSEERFRHLYNFTPVPLYSVDARGMIIDVSDYWLQLLGYRREEVMGHPDTAFMPDESAALMRDKIWPAFLKSGSVRDIELQMTKKNGSTIDVLFSSTATYSEQEMFDRSYSVLVDVTARRAAETALAQEIEESQRMREMLHQSQKMEAVGQLTGGIAHDFNNLLTAINGNLDLLATRIKGDERVTRLIDAAERAVARGAGLTKQLLSFSRRQVLRPERFALASRFEGLLSLLTSSLRSDIELNLNLPPDLWPITADPNEFDLAIINICVNARDAMPEGGRLTISGENITHGPKNPIEGGLTGDFVRLSICDTGTGIAADMLEKVFEPFFTTKEVGKGTGLGLSQVYGFARQSGGMATVESQPGRGTAVSLYFPRAQKADEGMSAHVTKTAAAARLSGTLLLIDDDDDVADAVSCLLEDIGFTVTRVSSPRQALALMNEQRFDYIFSDIVMPGSMSGLDFAREVRRLYPSQQIVLATGHSQAATAAGQEFFILPKPYTREQLIGVFGMLR